MKHGLAHLLLAADVGLIALLAASSTFSPPSPPTRAGLYAQSGFTLLTMGLVPLAWAWVVRPGNLGPSTYYNLQGRRHVALGAMWAAASLGAVTALGLVLDLVGLPAENPAVVQLKQVITWPLAICLAASAGFAEEIFFRGLVQRRLGLMIQAVLFAFAHAGYASLLQVLGTLILGLAWGVAARHSLWVAIFAHTFYDVAVLAP